MSIEIHKLIGEATAYDKKQMLEAKRPKSWLKSVSGLCQWRRWHFDIWH